MCCGISNAYSVWDPTAQCFKHFGMANIKPTSSRFRYTDSIKTFNNVLTCPPPHTHIYTHTCWHCCSYDFTTIDASSTSSWIHNSQNILLFLCYIALGYRYCHKMTHYSTIGSHPVVLVRIKLFFVKLQNNCSQHNNFHILIWCFATCFNSGESSSGLNLRTNDTV